MEVPATSDPLKQDFRNFLYLAWGYLGLPEPTQIQYDIADYLQSNVRRRGIEAFRGVGKSWITAAYVCWRLYCNPQYKFLVVSGAKVLADNFSTFCLQIINLMPELAHLKPREDQREAKIQFDVGPATASKDPSVRSVGIYGMITGSRADEVIADDVESAQNALTQLMRDKTSEAIKEFDAVLKPGGKITFLGTPQCEQSIYNVLPSRGYTMRVWPARYPDAKRLSSYGDMLAPVIKKALDKNPKLVGKSTDPKRFSDIDLMEREASYGRSGFALQFMLDTSLSDSNRYPLKLSDLLVMSLDPKLAPPRVAWAATPELRWNDLPNVGLSGDFLYRPMFIEKEGWAPFTGCVMAIDPSGRGKDETGYAVIKMFNGTLFLVAWGGLKGGYAPENLQRLAQIAKLHNVNEVTIEPNFGDGMFQELFTPILNKIHPCSIDPEPVRHSIQKEKRIIDTLEPVLSGHRLVVDKAVIEQDFRSTEGQEEGSAHAHTYQGLFQLTRITRDRGCLSHDDRLDALAIAVAYWTAHMARDQDKAAADHFRSQLEKEIKAIEAYQDKWMNFGHKPKSTGWLS